MNDDDAEQSDMLIDDTNYHIDMNNPVEIEQCGCGKPNKTENFKCSDCGKLFCATCTDAPIGTDCLACLIVESNKIYTSTPEKRERPL